MHANTHAQCAPADHFTVTGIKKATVETAAGL